MKNQLQVSLFPYETNSQIESKVSDKIKPPKNSLILPSFLPSKRYQNRTITQLSKFTTVPKFEQNRTKPRYPPQKISNHPFEIQATSQKKRNHRSKKRSVSLSLSLSKNERTQENRVRVLDLRGGVLKSCPGDSRPSSPRGHPGHQILPVFHPSPRLTPSHPPRFVTLATSRWRTRVPPTLESLLVEQLSGR